MQRVADSMQVGDPDRAAEAYRIAVGFARRLHSRREASEASDDSGRK